MQKGITPRPASEDDLKKVAAIEKYSNRPAWSVESFRAELNKKKSHFWVLTDDETDEEILGFVVFSFPAEQAHIQTLAVARAARRQGLASELIRAVIRYVMRHKGETVALEVRKSNQPAISLYQGLGFVVVHTVKGLYPDGEDGYSLVYRCEREVIEAEESDEMDPAETSDEEDDDDEEESGGNRGGTHLI